MSGEQLREGMQRPAAWLHARVVCATRRNERGDMPGWILIVVITALIVFAIYQFLDDQLMRGFRENVGRVLNL